MPPSPVNLEYIPSAAWRRFRHPPRRTLARRRDANGGDLVEAVGYDILPNRTHHAASLAGRIFLCATMKCEHRREPMSPIVILST